MGFFDDVPVLNDVEDAAGTAWYNNPIEGQFDAEEGGGFADYTVDGAMAGAGATEDIIFGFGNFGGSLLGEGGEFVGDGVEGAADTAGSGFATYFEELFSGAGTWVVVGVALVGLYVIANSEAGEAGAQAAGGGLG